MSAPYDPSTGGTPPWDDGPHRPTDPNEPPPYGTQPDPAQQSWGQQQQQPQWGQQPSYGQQPSAGQAPPWGQQQPTQWGQQQGYPPQSYPQQQPAAPQQGYERAPQGYPGGYPQPGSGAFPAQAPGHGVGPVGYEQGYPGQQPGYPTQGYPTQGQQPGYPPQPASGSFPAQQPGYAQPGGYQQQYYGVEQPGGFQRPGPYGDPQRPVPGLDSLAVEPKRSKLPWILSGAVALIVIVVAILGFVAPGFFVTKTFDSTSLQNGVRNTLTNDYKIGGVGQVSCPSGQQVTVGATFTCTVSINGQQKTVTLRVQDSSGVYQVGQPN